MTTFERFKQYRREHPTQPAKAALYHARHVDPCEGWGDLADLFSSFGEPVEVSGGSQTQDLPHGYYLTVTLEPDDVPVMDCTDCWDGFYFDSESNISTHGSNTHAFQVSGGLVVVPNSYIDDTRAYYAARGWGKHNAYVEAVKIHKQGAQYYDRILSGEAANYCLCVTLHDSTLDGCTEVEREYLGGIEIDSHASDDETLGYIADCLGGMVSTLIGTAQEIAFDGIPQL